MDTVVFGVAKRRKNNCVKRSMKGRACVLFMYWVDVKKSQTEICMRKVFFHIVASLYPFLAKLPSSINFLVYFIIG